MALPSGRRRLAAVAPLLDVLNVQRQLEERKHPLHLAGSQVQVIICVDATCLWQSSATRGDVFLMVPRGHRHPWQPRNWSTWFVLDGPEGGRALQELDTGAGLNQQVQAVQRGWAVVDLQGTTSLPLCFLTGDGKAMQTMTPGEGKQCWNCNGRVQDLSLLTIMDQVDCHVRVGAFLPDIPPCRRVGDVVHATARVTTAIVKRLGTDFGASSAPFVRQLKEFIQTVQMQAQGLPAAAKPVARPSVLGTFDLTAGNLFASTPTLHDSLIGLVQSHFPDRVLNVRGAQKVSSHAVLRTMLRALMALHSVWIQKTFTPPNGVSLYQQDLQRFCICWHAFQWKPTVWVHWIVCHSLFFLRAYGTLYAFSSIPTEKRHQTFKRDLTQSFQGWRSHPTNPRGSGLTSTLRLDALDKGLELHGRSCKRPRLT